jgi:hypothetical protein
MNSVIPKKFNYYIVTNQTENKKVSKEEFLAFSQIKISEKFFSIKIESDKVIGFYK